MQQKDRRCNFLLSDNPDKSIQLSEIEAHARDCQIVSLQAPGHVDALKLIRMYKFEGKKVVLDYDDYSFDLNPCNPRYADLGTKEVQDETGKWIWRDGENGFDLGANIGKFEAFKACVREADLVTTTTPLLAQKFREITEKVAVVPNSIDLSLWRPLPKKDDGLVRVGWSGGDSHGVDIKLLKAIAPTLCAKYPQLRFVLQCPRPPMWDDIFASIPPDRLEWHDWADLRFYTLILADRGIDIGLCPLDASVDFNRYKSPIKWMEFTALGAAVVAQNMPPYSESCRDGETALLASTPDEWTAAISNLVEDKAKREGLQQRAYRRVEEFHSLQRNWTTWDDFYADLLSN